MYRLILVVAVLSLAAAPASAQVVILHTFDGGTADGKTPLGSLTQSASTLFGTTADGGTAASGTIFGLAVDGTK
jgi:hypothetical protein